MLQLCYRQKHKTSFASAKYNFEHSLVAIDQLGKYFDASQLTTDLDGSLHYNNEHWIDFRIVMLRALTSTSNGLRMPSSCFTCMIIPSFMDQAVVVKLFIS
jgi:hypothetical protein